MSLHLPAGRRALAAGWSSTIRPIAHRQQYRSFNFKSLWGGAESQAKEISKVIDGQRGDLSKKAQESALAKDQEAARPISERLATPMLSSQSIFDEKDAVASGAGQTKQSKKKEPQNMSMIGLVRTYEAMARSTDPDPRSRARWQRKMVVRQVARALDPWGRETKAERLARTERTLTYRGPVWHLSVKKHVKLAHQIAGRTLDDAMVQMRFSKKKHARDIGITLDAARDEAATVAGMGIKDLAAPKVKGEKIQLKNGQWVHITDPTKLYIEQAWVNKGRKVFSGFVYPARRGHVPKWGQTTNLNLVLKEQKTLVREYRERKAKEDKRKPWVHLPNRPVTAQRQHYSW